MVKPCQRKHAHKTVKVNGQSLIASIPIITLHVPLENFAWHQHAQKMAPKRTASKNLRPTRVDTLTSNYDKCLALFDEPLRTCTVKLDAAVWYQFNCSSFLILTRHVLAIRYKQQKRNKLVSDRHMHFKS